MKVATRFVISLIIVTVIASMIPVSAGATGTIAWGAANINGSGVRVRSGPSTSDSVLTHTNTGDIVVIIERTNSEWHKVNFHGTEGYISVPFLDNRREAANFNKRGSVTGSNVNMRARPNTSSSILSSHHQGTVMSIIGINEGWYKVEHGGHTGYIRSDLMAPVAGGTQTSAPTPSRGQQIADYATGFVGHRYVWGGTSPSGFDCSGLVTYVMRNFGISVTRYSAGQFRDNGRRVEKSEMQPGDLVFFKRRGSSTVNHVGIYIGNDRFVHAQSSRTGVVISSMNTASNIRTFAGAKRLT